VRDAQDERLLNKRGNRDILQQENQRQNVLGEDFEDNG
jgi:hypothetical protein